MTESSRGARWAFVRHHLDGGNTWVWQRFGPDGRIEKTSEPHAGYGKALVSALQNGFKPDQDDYSLDLPSGRMHFPPGRIPEFVSTGVVEQPLVFEDRHVSRRPAPPGSTKVE